MCFFYETHWLAVVQFKCIILFSGSTLLLQPGRFTNFKWNWLSISVSFTGCTITLTKFAQLKKAITLSCFFFLTIRNIRLTWLITFSLRKDLLTWTVFELRARTRIFINYLSIWRQDGIWAQLCNFSHSIC